jgi:hypothetical protein
MNSSRQFMLSRCIHVAFLPFPAVKTQAHPLEAEKSHRIHQFDIESIVGAAVAHLAPTSLSLETMLRESL